MTGEQTSIPVSDDEPTPIGPCRWCGERSVGMVVVEKERHTTAANGIRVLKRRALEAPACQEHIDILERQPQDES